MASHSDPAHAHHHHGTTRADARVFSHSLPAGRLGSIIDHVRLFCAEEVELWKKITMIGSVAVCGVLLNWMAGEHHHMHKPPPYPYLKIRNKPLPWGDGTKDLLDVRDSYVDDHDDHH